MSNKETVEDDLPFTGDLDCSVEETGTSDMSLMDAVNEWALDCNIGLVEVQKLSAILKERGLI